jgi:DNA polymerase III alpha subunit
VRRSAVECAVEDDLGVRVGLGYVSGVRDLEVTALIEERDRSGPYESIPDLAARSGMGV